MHIYCDAEQRSAIKEIIQVESGKRGLDFLLLDNSDSIIIAEFGGTYVDIHETDDAMKQTQEMLTKIKDRFPSVTINGSLSIGSKNYRITYFFDSPKNCRDVTVEFTMGDDIPISECWFPFWTNGNYGLDLTGFVSKDEFEEFMEYTADFREENGVSFDLFIHSDLLDTFFETDEEAMDLYPNFEDSKELHDFYESVWKKYQEEENEDQDDEPSPSDGE